MKKHEKLKVKKNLSKKPENKEINLKKEQKKPLKKSNPKAKILKIILITCISIILLILIFSLCINSIRNFNYAGVDFKTVQEGKLTLYQTSIPVMYKGSMVPYSFYFRTNPRQLVKVSFDSENFSLMKNAVISFDKEFDCNGDAIIAVANLAKLHEVLGIKLMRDEEASCDARYDYFKLKEGQETGINKLEDNCYEIVVGNCEILKATERYMLEMFIQLNK